MLLLNMIARKLIRYNPIYQHTLNKNFLHSKKTLLNGFSLKKLKNPKGFPLDNSKNYTPSITRAIYTILYGTKKIAITVAVAFILASGYVVFTEYLEDKHNRKRYSAKPPIQLKGNLSDFPTAVLPNYEKPSRVHKPKLIILGSGWGATSVISTLDKDAYDVYLVSPFDHFTFTPLLPSGTVGTLELRSLMESIRKLLRRVNGTYIAGRADDVYFDKKLVLVEGIDNNKFYLPYDKLVIAVGSKSITHGVKGIEYCNFLKNIKDAHEIKKKIKNNLETACLPSTSPQERERLLSFVICGGGPTGVEFAAELDDFFNTDIPEQFPHLSGRPKITIIQSRDHILNTYDQKISEYAEKRFKHHDMDVITSARVKEITPDSVIYSVKDTDGGLKTHSTPQGFVLWSTGIDMSRFVSKIAKKIDAQTTTRALTPDPLLRVKGISSGSVFAIGDCSTIENPKLINRIEEYFKEADLNRDNILSHEEFSTLSKKLAKLHPQTSLHLQKASALFEEYDTDKSGGLDFNEFSALLKYIDSKLTSLPATAQVASQQGKYVAKILNDSSAYTRNLTQQYSPSQLNDEKTVYVISEKVYDYENKLPIFKYQHLGSLAYIGNSAVAELDGPSKFIMVGFGAMYLWRSVYWSEQVSMRTHLLLSLDWTKRIVFGRDMSRFN
jgi:NADH dehydrogenase